jgi:hypothetical protein
MGQFGDYDDQGDIVQDLVAKIEKVVLPIKLRNLPLYVTGPCKPPKKGCEILVNTSEHRKNEKAQQKYIVEHPNKVWRTARVIMHKQKTYKQDFVIAGLAIYLARGWNGSSRLPKKLDINFPKSMQLAARKASQREYKNDSDFANWKDPVARKRALKHQIRLFSASSSK